MSSTSPSNQLTATLYGPYHEAAAVLSTFSTETLHPHGAADDVSIDDVLVDSMPVPPGSTRGRWALLPAVRENVLRQLGNRSAMASALSANPVRPDDAVQ